VKQQQRQQRLLLASRQPDGAVISHHLERPEYLKVDQPALPEALSAYREPGMLVPPRRGFQESWCTLPCLEGRSSIILAIGARSSAPTAVQNRQRTLTRGMRTASAASVTFEL
jgi:hypothetical protein